MGLFSAFKKKNKDTRNCGKVAYTYRIKYNASSPSKLYEISSAEEKFIHELFSKSEDIGLSPVKFSFTRMSNGTISVDYDYSHNGGFIGKVKLQGRKTYIMYMQNLYDSDTVYGDVDECIKVIDNWLAYIKKYLK